MSNDNASSTKSHPSGKRAEANKLPRLPKHARIHKRPIIRPPIPSPYASNAKQKVVYISTYTPFIPAVKRVRSLLEQAEKRAEGPLNLLQGKGNDRQKLRKLAESIEKSKGKKAEEVVLKATGRAIERVLGLGLYFQGQPDCAIRIRTGSVGVVDDIVVQDEQSDAEGDEELPETRIRKTSVVEVAVRLK